MPIEAKPILFNTEMVLKILEGRKCVTRRAVKPQPPNGVRAFSKIQREGGSVWRSKGDHVWAEIKPPYHPGDILYVRETFDEIPVNPDGSWSGNRSVLYYKADGELRPEAWRGNWRPSIHMPKGAARLFLRVETVRVERLQDISEEQARAEGAIPFCLSVDSEDTPDSERTWHEMLPSISQFIHIWDHTIKPADLNKYGWSANPWVWVIEFEHISKNAALNSGDVT